MEHSRLWHRAFATIEHGRVPVVAALLDFVRSRHVPCVSVPVRSELTTSVDSRLDWAWVLPNFTQGASGALLSTDRRFFSARLRLTGCSQGTRRPATRERASPRQR